MKIRQGFVSNSSSSSFVCDVCGNTETGYDLSLSDVGMMSCVNEHIFCESEAVKPIPQEYLDEGSELYNEDVAYGFCVPIECCPICTYEVHSISDMSKFLTKKYGNFHKEAFDNVKASNSRRRVLRDEEYIMFMCLKFNTSASIELAEIKQKFPIYNDFLEWVNK